MSRHVREGNDSSQLSRPTKPPYFAPNFFYHSPQQHNISQNIEFLPNNTHRNSNPPNIKQFSLLEKRTNIASPIQPLDEHDSPKPLQTCLTPPEQQPPTPPQQKLESPQHQPVSPLLQPPISFSPPPPMEKCKLCWEDVPHDAMFTLAHCQCSFCSKVLHFNLLLLILLLFIVLIIN